MRMSEMTSAAFAAALSHRPTVILPAGATEQHGAAGPLGTDALVSDAIAREVGQRAGIPVAPALTLGMSQFHLGFAGTISLRPSTLAAVVRDVLASLALHGVRHVFILNGHGGNVAPIVSGVQEFHAERSFAGNETPARLHVLLRSWWDLPAVAGLCASSFGDGEGRHVTASEIAILRHLTPEIMPDSQEAPARQLTASEALVHAGDRHHDAADFKQRFADGRIASDPSLATPAIGSKLFEAAVQGCLAEILLLEADRAD